MKINSGYGVLRIVMALPLLFAPVVVSAQDLEPPQAGDIQELLENVEDAAPMPEGSDLNSVQTNIDDINKRLSELPEDGADQDFDEDVFFDAEQLVPEGEMGRKGGPKKVDPRVSPASKFVIVRENHSAGSKSAQLVAAERAMKLGRYDSALEIYDRMYVSNKRDPNVLMGRAITLQKMGRDDEAITAYEQLLTIRPKNIEAQINMIGLMASRYPAVALRRLEELSAKNPQNVGLIAQAAFIHARMANHGEAIRYLGMAASMEPQNANHIYNMAIIADRAGAKKDAIKYYEQALEIDTLYGAGKTIPRESVFERLAQLR